MKWTPPERLDEAIHYSSDGVRSYQSKRRETMSKIQWTDETWNPVTGCTKVSAGCKFCYAERDWGRVYGAEAPANMKAKYGTRKFGDVMCHEDRLDQPSRWQKPRLVFVNSMSDLFHESVPDDFLAKCFEAMAAAKQHTFQVLTKRPERMRDFLAGTSGAGHNSPPIPNIWLGVSCEDQETAEERIPMLLDTPAAIRFISAEPLLGRLDLIGKDAQSSLIYPYGDQSGLDWVIVGGESGPTSRPCDQTWIRYLAYQCREAGVPIFVKQLGANPTLGGYPKGSDKLTARHPDVILLNAMQDRKGGNMDEWPEDLRVREWPTVPGGVWATN